MTQTVAYFWLVENNFFALKRQSDRLPFGSHYSYLCVKRVKRTRTPEPLAEVETNVNTVNISVQKDRGENDGNSSRR